MKPENLESLFEYSYISSIYDADDIWCGIITPKDTFVNGVEELKHCYSSAVVIPTQTHSDHVEIIEENINEYPATDALISFIPGKTIGVITADCVPILIYSPDVRGVAAIHAGWKGTLSGIIDRTIEKLQSHGADPANMKVWFGPSICQECYEVDSELAEKFSNAGFERNIQINKDSNKPHIDLQGVNVTRLLRKGVYPENINLCNLCTKTFKSPDSEIEHYPSYRRDGTASLRLLTSISISKM
ncbi:MAG: peptidoglycan editing factor PgeF [Muribaculaceae bacterium]|nr:peptidoglycan editing factor PgeF [Muribaculaceae bacterium]MDE6559559.1 peptidoglycan editing factor PgeF [Muribaculaceae bacterium]